MSVSVTLKDGTTFRGDTPSEVIKAMHLMNHPVGYAHNPDTWYYSESKDRDVLIADMHDNYLKNALLKRYELWVEELHLWKGLRDVIDLVRQGPTDDPVFMGLYKEAVKRTL